MSKEFHIAIRCFGLPCPLNLSDIKNYSFIILTRTSSLKISTYVLFTCFFLTDYINRYDSQSFH